MKVVANNEMRRARVRAAACAMPARCRRALRRNGAAQAIEVEHNPLFHALRKEKFHASILDMELDGTSERVLLRDFQMHPTGRWCCTSISSACRRTRRSTCGCRCTLSARRIRRRSSWVAA